MQRPRPGSKESWISTNVLPSVYLAAVLALTVVTPSPAQPIASTPDAPQYADLVARSRAMAPVQRNQALDLFKTGLQLWKSGNFASAMLAFKQGLDIDPANGPANYYYADCLHRLGNETDAREYYFRAITLGGSSKEAFLAQTILWGAQSTDPPPRVPFPLKSWTAVYEKTEHNGEKVTKYTEIHHERNFGDEESIVSDNEDGIEGNRYIFAVTGSTMSFYESRYNNIPATISKRIRPNDTALNRAGAALAMKSGQDWLTAFTAADGSTPTGQQESHAGESCAVYKKMYSYGDHSRTDFRCYTVDAINLHNTTYDTSPEYGQNGLVAELIATSVMRNYAGPESDWEIPPGVKVDQQ